METLMSMDDNDFAIIYGNVESNTGCENICNKCSYCCCGEYTKAEIGYNDNGDKIIVACSDFNEWE